MLNSEHQHSSNPEAYKPTDISKFGIKAPYFIICINKRVKANLTFIAIIKNLLKDR